MTPRTVRLLRDYNNAPSVNETLIEAVKGNPLAIEVGIFQDGIPFDLTSLTSVSFVVRTSRAVATNLATDTIAVAAMTQIPNRARWDRGTAQHGTFAFTDAEMNLTVTSPYTDYWWSAYALPTNNEEITLGMGTFRLYESNIANGGIPAVNPGATITAAEADAAYLKHTANGATTPLNKRGTISLGAGVVAGTLTFAGDAFASAPSQVLLTVEMTDGNGALIFACCHTRVTASFKWELSGPTPDASHKLHWLAIQ